MTSTTAYVCVHGIGVHESGHLAAQTHDSARRGAEAAGGTLTDLPVDAAAPAELSHRARVELPGREPFIAEFHDGWWDSGTRAPHFWAVLMWLLEVAPFALISGVGGWCGDRWREAGDGARPQTVAGPLRTAGRRVGALVTSAAMLAAVPPAALVLLVLLPLAGLIPAWRRRLRPLMVEVIGDAWLYRSAALDETVLPRLRRIVEEASARADRVVLVGHSQGAELSRRVALQTTAAGCVWLGSGEHQLNTVRIVAASGWPTLLVWPAVLAWPALVHLVISRSGDVVALVVALLYLLITASVVRWVRRRPDDVGQVPQSRIWHVKSLLDPVSWGTVFPARLEAAREQDESASPGAGALELPVVCVRYVPKHPHRPWWAEHVTYLDRAATGAVLIEAGLPRPVPVLPPTPARVRTWVVLAAACAGIVLLWTTARLTAWPLLMLG
ncbi:hypothetical protein Q7C18_01510 [Nesterenkonia sp. CL21]|uniref:hypothetical protein n=1 Tax=Nesterenkonia sp. CL21 TaxID=3064894 RepID=UPI002878A9DE|nr:hypothetical protein [Nesterenkonia sp. CL21]MDS2171374.1 hypothetical protein [Nesterenkonia sp. CL21]